MKRDLVAIAGGLSIAVSGTLPIRLSVGAVGATAFSESTIVGLPLVILGAMIALAATAVDARRIDRRTSQAVIVTAAAVAGALVAIVTTVPAPSALPASFVGTPDLAVGLVAFSVGLCLVVADLVFGPLSRMRA